jgi:hypothetical protein
MRHRHRVHELEAENASLKARLDHLLEMPDASSAKRVVAEPAAPALPEPAASNGEDKTSKKSRKRVSITTDSEPVTIAFDGATQATPAEEPTSTEPEPAEETAAQA